MKVINNTTSYFDPAKNGSSKQFYRQLLMHLRELDAYNRDIVIVCIGSDRATGDCLGPLVGDKLNKCSGPFYIYGTLEQPVHAKNLNSTLAHINNTYRDPLIIAIDASLGSSRHVGYVTIIKGALRPGVGVDKDLPIVGDISITGIVNVSGMLNQLLIQNTRLSLVMRLADFISCGLKKATSLSFPRVRA